MAYANDSISIFSAPFACTSASDKTIVFSIEREIANSGWMEKTYTALIINS